LGTDQETETTEPSAPALLLGRDQKTSIIRLEPRTQFPTHRGTIFHDDLIGLPWGTQVSTHLGEPLILLRSSADDTVRNLKRSTQAIYPKDARYILMMLNIAPGCQVVEAGTGSGRVTLVLAQAVQPTGRVVSYETRLEIQELARENLKQLNVAEYVVSKERDIAEGSDDHGADALFLHIANPWDYLEQAHAAL
jgi:tRNA (adenine57-N1/adenine58-N1)-methyltransferase